MKCRKCGHELHGLQTCLFCGATVTAGSGGRVRRSRYWSIMIPSIAVNILSCNGIAKNFGSGSQGNEWHGVLWLFLSLACGAVMIWATVGRLHDLDLSGWWWVAACIPYVGVVVIIFIGCLEGTTGPNRFGGDPKKRSRTPASHNAAGRGHGSYAKSAFNPGSATVSGAGRCHACGTRLGSGEKFCPQCGKAAAAEAPPCRKCGEKLDAGQKFCPKCGTAATGSIPESKSGAQEGGGAFGTDGVSTDRTTIEKARKGARHE